VFIQLLKSLHISKEPVQRAETFDTCEESHQKAKG
jgi:hypothetical protein